MAALETEDQTRAQLNGILNTLASIHPSDLVRTQELGPDLNFEYGVFFFSRTLRLFHALHEADLSDIPNHKLTQLVQAATQTKDLIDQIQHFSLQKYSSSPIGTRDQFINQVRDSYDSAFEIVAPVIAYTIRKGSVFARLEEQARQSVTRLDEIVTKQKTMMEAARDYAGQLLKEVQRIAQEAGVSQHAVHFKAEADTQEADATKWLTATIWLGSGTALVGLAMLIFYFVSARSLTPTQSLQLAISKIVLLSVLFTSTLWSGKTYKAHRHNAVVNRHREHALATFQAFAKAADDPETKNAVLLQATQCIFAPQPTGYIGGESDTGGFPHVLEIIRDLGKTK
jgi:hypothetical protein